MPPSTISAVIQRRDPVPADAFGEVDLDVEVSVDAAVGYTIRGCDTIDNCGSTCASACASS